MHKIVDSQSLTQLTSEKARDKDDTIILVAFQVTKTWLVRDKEILQYNILEILIRLLA